MAGRQPFPSSAFPPTPDGDGDDDDAAHKRGPQPDPLPSVVDTPTSPASTHALARFEFETGRGNDGTKVLLVEWEDTAAGPEWTVTWEGKAGYDVLAAPDRDQDRDQGRDQGQDQDQSGTAVQRVYFLLPPGAPVPPLVRIARSSSSSSTDDVLWTRPMPAIFPPSLRPGGDDDRDHRDDRGVLHALWARHRLAGLAAEIEAEMAANSESVGLHIALQEQAWIAEHFGTTTAARTPTRQPTPGSPSTSTATTTTTSTHQPYAPTPLAPPTHPSASSSSSVGGSLGDKLRGLRLATSPTALAAASAAAAAAGRAQRSTTTAVGSIDAALQASYTTTDDAADAEDELFALPLSPRSPEMAKSPFSLL